MLRTGGKAGRHASCSRMELDLQYTGCRVSGRFARAKAMAEANRRTVCQTRRCTARDIAEESLKQGDS